jgi:hypothetical protein
MANKILSISCLVAAGLFYISTTWLDYYASRSVNGIASYLVVFSFIFLILGLVEKDWKTIRIITRGILMLLRWLPGRREAKTPAPESHS